MAARITPDMIRALCAPPMAGGVHKTLLVWRDDQAVVIPDGSAFQHGGRIVCTRADLLGTGLRERADGSLAGLTDALARQIARDIDGHLTQALATT